MAKWPNLFIVGQSKAGTTSLYEYLRKIPDIYMSPVKEPHYFSRNSRKQEKFFSPINNEKQYLQLFKNVANEKIIGEASPSYFSMLEVPKLIHEVSPNAHIIISLRDPIERFYTSYLMGIRDGKCKLSFKEELELALKNSDTNEAFLRLKRNVHSESVKRYLEIFGEKHVKILIFEEWTKNIKSTIECILEFLGLDLVINNDKYEVYNPNVIPRGKVSQKIVESYTLGKIANNVFSNSSRNFLKKILLKKAPKPKINNNERQLLIDFFYDDVKNLEKILKRKLPWQDFN